jgi:hypothetical protein
MLESKCFCVTPKGPDPRIVCRGLYDNRYRFPQNDGSAPWINTVSACCRRHLGQANIHDLDSAFPNQAFTILVCDEIYTA